MQSLTSFWLSVALIGVLIVGLSVQIWYLGQVVRGLLSIVETVQDPSIVVLQEVSQVESRLKTRLEEVESLVAERLNRSNELADEASRSYRSARSAEERTRRHADRVEEAEYPDGGEELAPWDADAAPEERPAEVVEPTPGAAIAAWAYNRRRR